MFMLALIGGFMTHTATAQIDQSYRTTKVEKNRDLGPTAVATRPAKSAHKFNKVQKRKIKAMKKVAKADGRVTRSEKAMIKKERRKMKRKNKNRLIDRQAPIRRN